MSLLYSVLSDIPSCLAALRLFQRRELVNVGLLDLAGKISAFDAEGALTTLAAMAGALDAGDNVTVAGQATKDELAALIVSTVRVEVNGEDGAFEGRVVSVDTDVGTFTLANKRTYTVLADLVFDDTGTIIYNL